MEDVKVLIDKKILCLAIKERLNKILIEYDITINELASRSELTQSTVDSIFNGRSTNPTVLTIWKICDGLGITLQEFFTDEIFSDENIRKLIK